MRQHVNPIHPQGPEAQGACRTTEELHYVPVDQRGLGTARALWQIYTFLAGGWPIIRFGVVAHTIEGRHKRMTDHNLTLSLTA